MNRLKKSHSNPSKISYYSPAYNGSSLAPQSTRAFLAKSSSTIKLNKSLSSTSKKFGIRQIQTSPSSKKNKKNEQQSRSSKITINAVNMNLVIQEKANSKITSPLNIYTQKNKSIKDYYTSRVNYFKSNNANRVNMNITKKQKREQSLVSSTKPKKEYKSTPFNFQPIKKISNGQYGGLYLAYEKQTNFVAVLKAFSKEKITLDFMIDQFKIQMYCQHPNILPAYGFFFGRTQIYLIMEAGSHNLYSEIKKAGYFSEKKAANYIKQVMKGMSYLHLNGIIHRDIKPQNIIISGGMLKISDFGWSAITNCERKTFCGTLDYLSPEVAEGCNYGSKIDTWSVGVLLYQMLTGFPPYQPVKKPGEKKPILDFSKQIVYPNRVSKQCVRFIKRMLTLDPEQRPTIIEALRDPWLAITSIQNNKDNNNLKDELP